MGDRQRAFNPLHRVVGAVVLVALVVVFVPMLVQPSPQPPQPVVASAPVSAPARPARPRQVVPPAPMPRASEAVPVAPRPVLHAPPARVAAPAPPPPRPQPARRHRSQRRAVAGGAWYIQVASFAHVTDARHLALRLRRAGFRTHLERHGADVFRVQIGPYPSRRAADLAQTLLRRNWRPRTWVRRAAR